MLRVLNETKTAKTINKIINILIEISHNVIVIDIDRLSELRLSIYTICVPM